MMNFEKHFLKSKTLWGGFIAVLAGSLKYYDIEIQDTDYQYLLDAFETFGSLVGGLLAVYGRLTATTTLTK